ncbi:MAG: hypothetical protein NTZ38_01585 [Candidatus Taylorbacteria bacterium]|nr:hypothetical protein [Candidatus Taylorbacteria bacterium]
MDPFKTKLILPIISIMAALMVIIFIWLTEKRWNKSDVSKQRKRKDIISRHTNNPIMSPLSFNSWETSGVFNPAAIQDHNGRVHLLYRAVGDDGISRIGYASSANGLDLDERLSYPIFTMQKPLRDMPQESRVSSPSRPMISLPKDGVGADRNSFHQIRASTRTGSFSRKRSMANSRSCTLSCRR